MTDLELNIFFKDLEFSPVYDVEKIIYSETNNLDKYLFCSLNKRFNNYCLDWLKEKRANQTEYDLPRAEDCGVYKYSPESNKLALLAENLRNNHIVINHYTLDENQIVFQVENFQLTGCYSIWYNYLYSEIYRFQNIMHELFEIIKSKETTTALPQQNEIGNIDEVYKTENLFKVGLFFATDKMNEYFIINDSNKEFSSKNKLSPRKIAIELGNVSFEKWILASKNNYLNWNRNGNKNIFNNRDMMKKIISHCEASKIQVEPYFINRLPIE